MKIAQIAPLIESVPPRLYGGTERIASYVTEELVALGSSRAATQSPRPISFPAYLRLSVSTPACAIRSLITC